jgi:hypothetical protein
LADRDEQESKQNKVIEVEHPPRPTHEEDLVMKLRGFFVLA